MTHKLCCILDTHYICDGCQKIWCAVCARASNRGETDHPRITNEFEAGITGLAEHQCPKAGVVYDRPTDPREVKPPYHLTVGPNDSKT